MNLTRVPVERASFSRSQQTDLQGETAMKSMLGLTETFRLSPQVRAHSQSSGCEHVRRRDNVVTRNQDIRRQPCSVGNRRHTPQIYYRVWKIIMRRVIEVLAVAAALMMANASVAAQLNEAETALLSAVHKIRQDPRSS